MLTIDRFSASSITTLQGCEMKWFLNYILGYYEPNGNAATLGTAAHDVMEAVAWTKLLRQTGEKEREHKTFGVLKQTYDLEELTRISFEYHKNDNPHLKWTEKDYKKVKANVDKAASHRLFPENHYEVVYPEKYFRIEVPYDWATYVEDVDGKLTEKRLKITGKIDIVYRNKKGQLYYLDYKFGQKGPYDWNKWKNKTFDGMKEDIQLCLYYWAAKQLYEKESPVTQIWYVNTNDIWTDVFEAEQQQYALDVIRKCMNDVKAMQLPKTVYSKSCTFCPYKKKTFGQWGMPHLDLEEKGDEHFNTIDGKKCMCDAMKAFSKYRSIDLILENCKNVSSR